MKRIGMIAVLAWSLILASLVVHAAWAHHSLALSPANHRPPKATVHRLMLVSEGRDAVLAIVGLVAAAFVGRSSRRAPAVTVTAVAALALLLWGASFVTAVRHTDRTFFGFRPWTSTHSILLWHAFLESGVRCLLTTVGLTCGIAGMTMNKRITDAEQQGGGYSPPAARPSKPTP